MLVCPFAGSQYKEDIDNWLGKNLPNLCSFLGRFIEATSLAICFSMSPSSASSSDRTSFSFASVAEDAFGHNWLASYNEI